MTTTPAEVTAELRLHYGSSLWQPWLTFSMSDNADLGAFGWLGLGVAPHREGTTLVPTSEFGLVPTGLGAVRPPVLLTS